MHIVKLLGVTPTSTLIKKPLDGLKPPKVILKKGSLNVALNRLLGCAWILSDGFNGTFDSTLLLTLNKAFM
jgi:hypothetical protein